MSLSVWKRGSRSGWRGGLKYVPVLCAHHSIAWQEGDINSVQNDSENVGIFSLQEVVTLQLERERVGNRAGGGCCRVTCAMHKPLL
jgi:hypothetical protein